MENGKWKKANGKTVAWRRALVLSIYLLPFSLFKCVASAAPTQEDVFKSIQDNVGQTSENSHFLPFVIGTIAVLTLLGYLAQRSQKRDVTGPQPLNHQGKLLKEVLKAVEIKPAEIKRLKAIAEEKELSSPLVLLLCPSVLEKFVKEKRGTRR